MFDFLILNLFQIEEEWDSQKVSEIGNSTKTKDSNKNETESSRDDLMLEDLEIQESRYSFRVGSRLPHKPNVRSKNRRQQQDSFSSNVAKVSSIKFIVL